MLGLPVMATITVPYSSTRNAGRLVHDIFAGRVALPSGMCISYIDMRNAMERVSVAFIGHAPPSLGLVPEIVGARTVRPRRPTDLRRCRVGVRRAKPASLGHPVRRRGREWGSLD